MNNIGCTVPTMTASFFHITQMTKRVRSSLKHPEENQSNTKRQVVRSKLHQGITMVVKDTSKAELLCGRLGFKYGFICDGLKDSMVYI